MQASRVSWRCYCSILKLITMNLLPLLKSEFQQHLSAIGLEHEVEQRWKDFVRENGIEENNLITRQSIGMSKRFDLKKFALKLRIKQAEYRMSLTESAKEIGVSKATLSRLNREVGLPDVESYYKCCVWLEVPMNSFFI